MSTPQPASEPTTPPARSSRRWIGIVLVLLAAGGGGAYWWTRQAVAAAAPATAPAGEPVAVAEPGSLLPLDTFTVNLADPGGSRFLRVTVQLVLRGAATATDVQHDTLAITRIRSAVLELLTTQTSSTLVTPEGKVALKQEIATRVAGTVGHEVTDVLFSEFVVQF